MSKASPMLSAEKMKEIGQHFVLGFHGYSVSADVERLIREYFVGSIILMRRNVKSFIQVRALTRDLQRIAFEAGHEKPLLIGIDQECGLVSAFSSVPLEVLDGQSLANRTDLPIVGDSLDPAKSCGTLFPGALGLAAADDDGLIRDVYAATGGEMRLAGINWDYAPVADVNSNALNPVIGVRSFGDEPTLVGRSVAIASQALSDAGIAPCAKHFPGHGDTQVDSHLALPVIHKTLEDIQRSDLLPFSQVIKGDSGHSIPSIMTAHIALPQLLSDLSSKESRDTPASLSSSITTNLLRERLSFQGVVTTDCLEMDAISGGPSSVDGVAQASVRALQAGADIVMICHRMDRQEASLLEVRKALLEGALDYSQLKQSGERIANMKDRYAGGWKDVPGGAGSTKSEEDYLNSWLSLKSSHIGLAQRAHAASLAWIPVLASSPIHFTPISTEDAVVLLTPASESVNAAVDDDVVAAEAGWSPDVQKPGKGRNVDADAAGVVVSASSRAGAAFVSFAERISEKSPRNNHFVYTSKAFSEQERQRIVDAVRNCGVVIFTTRNSHTSLWQLEALLTVVQIIQSLKDLAAYPRLILVASCGPYDFLPLRSEASKNHDKEKPDAFEPLRKALPAVCSPLAALCTFGFTTPSMRAAADALFGTSAVTGKLPVRI